MVNRFRLGNTVPFPTAKNKATSWHAYSIDFDTKVVVLNVTNKFFCACLSNLPSIDVYLETRVINISKPSTKDARVCKADVLFL
jgi:hypothetical protein